MLPAPSAVPHPPELSLPTLAITAITSRFGHHAAKVLLTRGVDPASIVGTTRDPAKAADLAAAGIQIRQADYSDPASLAMALAGVDRLLLVSSGEGDRQAQHRNVIAAAKAAGVELIVYTSVINASTTKMIIAADHIATEQALAESGVPYVLLRNGWYTENYLMGVTEVLEHGLVGAGGDGAVNVASRTDYAEAAAVVLSSEGQGGKVYELAGDTPITLTEFAGLIGEAAGKPVGYTDVPLDSFTEMIAAAGLPQEVAAMLADSAAAVGRGELASTSTDLSQLLGRPTTPPAETIALAVSLTQG
jgi:NAD(P)H dehydrogenase (quinone)